MKYTKEMLEPIIKESYSLRNSMLKLGLSESGGGYSKIKKLIAEFNLDTTHFTGPLWNKGKSSVTDDRIKSKYTIDEMFCIDSMITNDRIKKILIDKKILEYKCCDCGNTGKWNGKPIVLELDHINGVNNDNRIENLRILCPNCHSQTPTFRRKKKLT